MRPLLIWISKQLDDGVTVVGAAIALLFAGSALLALFALASAQVVLAALFAAVFILLLAMLVATALTTDTTPKISREQRAALWAATPKFVKHGLFVLCVGVLGELLVELWTTAQPKSLLSHASLALASFIFAQGLRRERPPIPRGKEPSLRFETDRDAYLAAARPLIFGAYAVTLFFGLIFIVAAVKRFF